MSDARPISHDADRTRVEAAVDALLHTCDPRTVDDRTFRGARFDAGLAWVHFPTGFGGLGARPELNRLVEERLRAAGAAPQDPSTLNGRISRPQIRIRVSLC